MKTLLLLNLLFEFIGPDARHFHEGRVLVDAEEGAGQREESQGAHDPLRHAAKGEAA